MSRLWRSRLAWVVAALLLATRAGDSSVLASRLATSAMPKSVAVDRRLVTERPAAAHRRAAQRAAALTALFDARAKAIRTRDRAAFLAGLDPRRPDFVQEQTEVFASLSKLDFASWTYEVTEGSYSPGAIDYAKYGDATDLWLPVLILRYQLRGYDQRPLGRRVVYTVVRRGAHWYVGGDADLDTSTSSGTSVRVDPWENGPIVVKKSTHGLVIGHPDDAGTVDEIIEGLEDAITHVTKYVGREWPRRVVVVLPSGQDELDRVLEYPQVFFDFAAIADRVFTMSSEGQRDVLAGNRVVINPKHFDPDSAFTKTLLRHEITHVALAGRDGPDLPKWLVEGVAEYVGNDRSTIPVEVLGGDLGKLVDRGKIPAILPGDSDFGLIDDAGVAYESAWLVCRYIVARYGPAALFRLYDEAAENGQDVALRSVLHTDEATLLRGWRPYARAAVADLGKLLVKPTGYSMSHHGEVDPSSIADEHELDLKRLTSLGVERGGEGLWFQGRLTSPTRWLFEALVVNHDEASAVQVEREFAKRYGALSGGRAIPRGRLYLVGLRVAGRTYRAAVAIVRAGTVVIEVRVATVAGDPSGEALQRAAAQYAAVA